MRILSNSLALHTTFRTGGLAASIVTAQSGEELIALATSSRHHRILGKGSNTLAADEGFTGTVIKTTALRKIEISGNMVRVEAGLGLPVLVRTCAKHGLGGCEYLVSVPGTVGGAVCMNAGRGRGKNQSISDHVVEVEIFNGQSLVSYPSRELRFGYRYSRLQEEPEWIVLAVILKMDRLPVLTIHQRIQERIEHVRIHQDIVHPNAGTIFSHGFKTSLARPGYRIGGAAWSVRTANWINNIHRASSRDILQLIQEMRTLHRLQGYSYPIPEIKYLGNDSTLESALDSVRCASL